MSLIDNFFSRIRAFVSVLFQWLLTYGKDAKIIGIEARIKCVDMFDYIGSYNGIIDTYCSISKEPPYQILFDDYGIPDDEIFHYFASVREVLKYCLTTNKDECFRIHSCRLVTAKEELSI